MQNTSGRKGTELVFVAPKPWFCIISILGQLSSHSAYIDFEQTIPWMLEMLKLHSHYVLTYSRQMLCGQTLKFMSQVWQSLRHRQLATSGWSRTERKTDMQRKWFFLNRLLFPRQLWQWEINHTKLTTSLSLSVNKTRSYSNHVVKHHTFSKSTSHLRPCDHIRQTDTSGVHHILIPDPLWIVFFSSPYAQSRKSYYQQHTQKHSAASLRLLVPPPRLTFMKAVLWHYCIIAYFSVTGYRWHHY